MADETEIAKIVINTDQVEQAILETEKLFKKLGKTLGQTTAIVERYNSKGQAILTVQGRIAKSNEQVSASWNVASGAMELAKLGFDDLIEKQKRAAEQASKNAAAAQDSFSQLDRIFKQEISASENRVTQQERLNRKSEADEERHRQEMRDTYEKEVQDKLNQQKQLDVQNVRTRDVQAFRNTPVSNISAVAGTEGKVRQALDGFELLILKGKTTSDELNRIYNNVLAGVSNEVGATNRKIETTFINLVATQKRAAEQLALADKKRSDKAIASTKKEEEARKKLEQQQKKGILDVFGSKSPTKALEDGLKQSNILTQALSSSLFTIKRLLIFDIAGSAIAKLTQALRQSVEDARQFSKEIALVTTITKESELTFNQASDGVVELSKKFGRSGAEVAKAAYEALSNQITTTTDTFPFLDEALKFSIATGTDAAHSGDLLASAINSYGLAAEDAAKISAILFTGIDKGRFKAEELSGSLGTVTVPAHVLGVSLEEVAAAIAVLTQQGIPTNVAMTQLRNIFQKLIRPSEAMKELFAELGVESGEAAIKSKTFAGFLQILDERTRGASDELGELLLDVRAINPGIALTGKGLKTFNNILNEFTTESAQNYMDAFTKVMESDGQRLDVEFNKLKVGLQETFGKSTVKGILLVADAFGGLDKAANQFIDTVVFHGPPVTKVLNLMGQETKALELNLNKISDAPQAISAEFSSLQNKYSAVVETMVKDTLLGASRIRTDFSVFGEKAEEALEKNLVNSTEALKAFVDDLRKEISDTNSLINNLDSRINASQKRIAALAKSIRENALSANISKIEDQSSRVSQSSAAGIQEAIAQADSEADAREKVLLEREKELAEKRSVVSSDTEDPLQKQKLSSIDDQQADIDQARTESAERLAQDRIDIALDESRAKLKIMADESQAVRELTQQSVNDLLAQSETAFSENGFANLLGDIRTDPTIAANEISARLEASSDSFNNGSELVEAAVETLNSNLQAVESKLETARQLQKDQPSNAANQTVNNLEQQRNDIINQRDGLLEKQQAREEENAEILRQINQAKKNDLTELEAKERESVNLVERKKDLELEIVGLITKQKEVSDQLLATYQQINAELSNMAANLPSGEAVSRTGDRANTTVSEIVGNEKVADSVEEQSNVIQKVGDAWAQTLQSAENYKIAVSQAKELTTQLAGPIKDLFTGGLPSGFEDAFASLLSPKTLADVTESAGAISELFSQPKFADDLAQLGITQEELSNIVTEAGKKVLETTNAETAAVEALGTALNETGQIGVDVFNQLTNQTPVQAPAQPTLPATTTPVTPTTTVPTGEELAKNTTEATAEMKKFGDQSGEVKINFDGVTTTLKDGVTPGLEESGASSGELKNSSGEIKFNFDSAGQTVSVTLPAGLADANIAANTLASDGLAKAVEQSAELAANAERARDALNEANGSGGGTPAEGAPAISRGGFVADYLSKGGFPFIPRGSDRVPAMLDRREFVVNGFSTSRNKALLAAINRNDKNLSHYLPGVSGSRINPSQSSQSINLEFGDINIDGSNINTAQLANSLIKEIKTKIRRGEIRL